NLLQRINRELGADFHIKSFDHYATYDPENGLCKSYLVSLQEQIVNLEALKEEILFQKNETIFMERSQKYTHADLEKMAAHAGFQPVRQFMDHKKWFVDALWKAI